MGWFVVAEFLLTSASRGPSAIAEPLVRPVSKRVLYQKSRLLRPIHTQKVLSHWREARHAALWLNILRDT